MRRNLVFAAACALLLSLPAVAGHGGELPFTTEVDEALAQAARAGKPYVLYFTAEW